MSLLLLLAQLATTFAAPVLGAQETDPKERAWEIYERARERVIGESAEPVRDYTFDLVTRTANPKEKDKQIELISKGFFLTPDRHGQDVACADPGEDP